MDVPPLSSITSLKIYDACKCHNKTDKLINIRDLDLTKLENLEVLLFRDCLNLTKLPANAFVTAPNLKVLDLEDNNLTDVNQNALKGLRNLEFIDLTDNGHLKILPDGFFEDTPAIAKINISETALRYNLITSHIASSK